MAGTGRERWRTGRRDADEIDRRVGRRIRERRLLLDLARDFARLDRDQQEAIVALARALAAKEEDAQDRPPLH